MPHTNTTPLRAPWRCENAVTSTPDGGWRKVDLKVQSSAGEPPEQLSIDTSDLVQVIEGFGGCFNELGWVALQAASEKVQREVLLELFDPRYGCRFNYCRIPIGANDYAIDWYSHNETRDDYDMINFSIERDVQFLIPFIRAAMEINPDLKLWASPWCPPSWMKRNSNYAGQSDPFWNNLEETLSDQEMVTAIRGESEVLEAYARYFSLFLDAYARHNLPIRAVHVQNEPNSSQIFPSCIWHPDDLRLFISRYLGPTLRNSHPEVELWLGTIERPHLERILPILEDEQARQYIRGVGFQWGGKGAIGEIHARFPELELMQTETECGSGANSWADATHTWSPMHHYFESGAGSYMAWNMVLDESGLSSWGWKQNALISLRPAQGEVSFNPEFFLLRHFSSCIEPGARRLRCQDHDARVLAFLNPDGAVIIIVHNDHTRPVTLSLKLDDQQHTLIVPETSFTTSLWRRA